MRCLLIRPGAIGDCILSLPALEHLKADYTEVWIPSPVVPLITFADAVRPLASTGIDLAGVGDLGIPAQLKATLKSFDSIVSWYGAKRSEFRETILGLGVPCDFHSALPPEGYCGHATDFFAQQVGAPQGLIPRIEVGPSSPRDAIVIHPFSGGRKKNWPLCMYRQLAARLQLEVEWIAGPEEPLTGARCFTNLADLASWMRGARLYIGNDSGVTHLAAATGLPTLALFGPSSAHIWAPRGENVRVLHASPIEELSVDAVLDQINQLLGLP